MITDTVPGIRLYVTAALDTAATVEITADQSHYLRNVMRQAPGDALCIFNGRDGEWLAEIGTLNKRGGTLNATQRLRDQADGPDLWLLFAPVKRVRIDQIAEKATELGVSVLWPVPTLYTNVGRINLDRLRARAIEAAEQSDRLTVPEVRDPLPLADVLDDWPAGRRLLHFDETGGGGPVSQILAEAGPTPRDALLVGPEGGFAPSELDGLRNLPFVTAITLGERILRSETAVVAALACWQALCGDWRG